MNKETWKRVFESFDDQDLIMLSVLGNIKVQGFRQINAGNIKGARKLVINEAIKPKKLSSIITIFNKKAESEEKEDEGKQFRSMNLDELLEAVENGTKPHEILVSLYSCKDEEKHKLAAELEEKLTEHGKSQPKEEESTPSPQENSTEDELRKIIIDLEKKLKKAEQKNAELSSKITKLEKNVSDAKEKLKEEKKELNKKLSQTGQELSKANGLLQKLEQEAEKNQKLLTEKDALVAERNAAISHLNARLLNSAKPAKEPDSDTGAPLQTGEPAAKKKIALLGNPKNKSIMKNEQYELAIFEASEIEDIFESVDWDEFKEVWLLNYKVPATKQAFIHTHLQKPVKIINTFMDLRNLIERGNRYA
ncbi:hypothetical protein A8F94_07325 [Bacillus sp. FJAT-27225]|uniref:hypothetical protein n=1 Tax=Bacillus sp. FJAT-27225 TaxID=1743144 RepID=UPI00080C3256|nr:hypothetical protein [Bacillus sp. FJAT-27225]OCA87659.1 hypothetical protein A8F94_07325 [Bacillus sp. FJAT-27225]